MTLPALLLAAWSAQFLLAACSPPLAPVEPPAPPAVQLPLEPGSLRLAVIGDSGSGRAPQYQVGALLAALRPVLSPELVLMLGDNLYGSETPKDYERKFRSPYAGLLEHGVEFYAALGNHDQVSQIDYPLFHMGGHRYYSFEPPGHGVGFFALDSTRLDRPQLQWLQTELRSSRAMWKICFFHHPLFSSSGRQELGTPSQRFELEQLLVTYGVDVVLAGHDHFYERLQPQQGVTYFVVGAAAKLARARHPSVRTAALFDADRSFLLLEITAQALYFQALSRSGQTVDFGSIRRRERVALDCISAGQGECLQGFLAPQRPEAIASKFQPAQGVQDHPGGQSSRPSRLWRQWRHSGQ